MIIYKRHIEKRLLLLRLSFFILGAICAYAFINQYEKLGYFISVVLFTVVFIVIKDVIVSADSFQVYKFYFFGLIKRRWVFNKNDNVKVSTYGTDFGEDGDVPFVESSDAAPISILSFFLIFAPPKITMNAFKVQKFSETYLVISSVRVLLDKHEFNYLNSFIRRVEDL